MKLAIILTLCWSFTILYAWALAKAAARGDELMRPPEPNNDRLAVLLAVNRILQ